MKSRPLIIRAAVSLAFLTMVSVSSEAGPGRPYAFRTLAGSAAKGSLDGTGRAAQFFEPLGVAVDSAGTVYVADRGNLLIRKIHAGVVTTLAGAAGQVGSTDGTGSAARFFVPGGVAVDGAGTVYVADSGNSTIRKITPEGVVTTLAGAARQVGSADGPGTLARFISPLGLAASSAGTVYVTDVSNHTIRKITPAGVVTTLAGAAGQSGSVDGTGSAARFQFPKGVAVDSSGTVYVADTGNHTIRRITAAGVVTTLAGTAGQPGSADGTGSTARFDSPEAVAADSAGTVYVADTNNHTIRKITAGGVVTTLGGIAGHRGSADGTGSAAQFAWPLGVAVDAAGALYVLDYGNNTIRKGVIRTAGDYDGDGTADPTIFRPSSGNWFIRNSTTGFATSGVPAFGQNGDVPVSGDYDGDGVADLAVWRPSTGVWFIQPSSSETTHVYQWGLATDVPVPGDYDGDGKTDLGAWRPSTGTWFIRLSSTGYVMAVSYQWGLSGDKTVPGDYDGDGLTDIAVYRPSQGVWYILQSAANYTTSVAFQWGASSDITVPGDFDGDGKTDIAVYRPSTGIWFIKQSSTDYATSVSFRWGLSADTPVPVDFDGDGKTDVAVWRSSTGVWYVLKSSTNFTTSASVQWGQNGDVPILRRD